MTSYYAPTSIILTKARHGRFFAWRGALWELRWRKFRPFGLKPADGAQTVCGSAQEPQNSILGARLPPRPLQAAARCSATPSTLSRRASFARCRSREGAANFSPPPDEASRHPSAEELQKLDSAAARPAPPFQHRTPHCKRTGSNSCPAHSPAASMSSSRSDAPSPTPKLRSSPRRTLSKPTAPTIKTRFTSSQATAHGRQCRCTG